MELQRTELPDGKQQVVLTFESKEELEALMSLLPQEVDPASVEVEAGSTDLVGFGPRHYCVRVVGEFGQCQKTIYESPFTAHLRATAISARYFGSTVYMTQGKCVGDQNSCGI